jgi:hypothetical protein
MLIQSNCMRYSNNFWSCCKGLSVALCILFYESKIMTERNFSCKSLHILIYSTYQLTKLSDMNNIYNVGNSFLVQKSAPYANLPANPLGIYCRENLI